MDSEFVNQDLELAAKRTLTHITGSEDSLKPLYLQPDRALFLAENLRIILKEVISCALESISDQRVIGLLC
jgi:hypothetical protein